MKYFKRFATVVVIGFLMLSCDKDNDSGPTYPVLRNYAAQYQLDIANIESFLKTHSASVTNNPGFTDDQNVTFTEVAELDENSIWGSNPTVPKISLLVKKKVIGGVEHKIYYLKFREGTGASPTISSQVQCYYQGLFLSNTVFAGSLENGVTLNVNELIVGWQEILPEFKMGVITGTDQYEKFGAGVMFLPSALAYYNLPPSDIPVYSPLVFSFKLYNVF